MITVDFDQRIIELTLTPVSGELFVRADEIYSHLKEIWLSDIVAQGFAFPLYYDKVGAFNDVRFPIYWFLRAGWRIRPFNSEHSLTIDGDLYSESPLDEIFAPTSSTVLAEIIFNNERQVLLIPSVTEIVTESNEALTVDDNSVGVSVNDNSSSITVVDNS